MIILPGEKRYTPYNRKYSKKYYHQDYVVKPILYTYKHTKIISDVESEYRIEIKTPIGSKHVFIDFVIEKEGRFGFIEVDGPQHYEYCPTFHVNGITDFIKQKNRDKLVDQVCKKFGKIIHLNISDPNFTTNLKLFIKNL